MGETFRLFEQLKLDAPITTGDIPAVLEKLEVQLEGYKKKVEEWEENREEMKRKILDGLEEEEEYAEKEEKADTEKKAEEEQEEEKEEDEEKEEENDKEEEKGRYREE